MKNTLYMLTIVGFLFCSRVKADEYQYSHDWAHFGTSYAVQMVSYGMVKQLGLGQTATLIGSSIITFSGTLVYESLKPHPLDMRTIGMNAIGQGVAVGTVIMFDF